jgi:ABC-type spermidine/putrescine transport system permease subunit I
MISLIQISNLRVKSDFTSTEIFCSVLAIIIMLIYLLLPIILLPLYFVKIRSSKPLPDLDDRMSVEEI